MKSSKKEKKYLIAAIVIPIIIIASIGLGLKKTMSFTSSPKFCGSCHLMQTRYVSWKRSVHASEDAGCFDCHADPGVLGGLKAKINGIKYLYYCYAGYRDVQVLHAEVSNESCSRCHDIKAMDEKMEKRINPVQHTGDTHNPHVNKLNLSCSSCHENIMHITLLGESKKAWDSCKNCHNQTGFINLE